MARKFIKNLKDKYLRNNDHNYDQNANHSSLNISFKKYLCDFRSLQKHFDPKLVQQFKYFFLKKNQENQLEEKINNLDKLNYQILFENFFKTEIIKTNKTPVL